VEYTKQSEYEMGETTSGVRVLDRRLSSEHFGTGDAPSDAPNHVPRITKILYRIASNESDLFNRRPLPSV
jgi:hypothetical protein